MSDLQKVPASVQKQYAGLYGAFVSGDYGIGDTVSVPGTTGEVIWSFASASGLTYVVDDKSGFPVEVKAYEVRQAK